MSAPLPEFWTEEIDPKGRTYYTNHRTQMTQWERPVAKPPSPPSGAPPPFGSSTAGAVSTSQHVQVGQPAHGQAGQPGPCCTPRITFWVSCFLGWVVWAFAVGAAADNNWIKDESLAAGDENVLQACDDRDSAEDDSDFCDYFKAFTAMQLIAVLLASFSMVVYMVAPFRPRAGKCGSVKALAIGGAILMSCFAFFQMLAFVLMIVIEKDLDGDDDEFNQVDYKLGGTFAVAVIACILGVVQAGAVFVFQRSSGDGLFYTCCHQCMAMNVDPNAAVGGGGGGAWGGQQQQPQPPAPVQSAPAPAAPSTAAPPAAAPSTAAPSTAAPSTAVPSTAVPSTAAPSTAAPSTAAVAPPEPESAAV